MTMLRVKIEVIDCNPVERDALIMAATLAGVWEPLTVNEGVKVVSLEAYEDVRIINWCVTQKEHSNWKALLELARKIGIAEDMVFND